MEPGDIYSESFDYRTYSKGYMYWKGAFIPLAIVSLLQRAEFDYITGKIKCKHLHRGTKFALNNLIANY